MKNRTVFKCISLLVLLTILIGCSATDVSNCNMLCELGINQDSNITVENLTDILIDVGWITDSSVENLTATYETDAFSSVLETKVVIPLNESAPAQLVLYIGNIGGINPDQTSIFSEYIEGIQIESQFNVFQTLLQYGLPQGGRVLPIYTENDLAPSNPCPQRSHYIAYYDNGRTIIRATVNRPLLVYLWTTSVEMVYPVGDTLSQISPWVGRYERMDHRPCLVN